MAAESLILAVETSSRTGSVALARGPEMLGETTFSGPLRHSAEILPSIGDLLQQFGFTTDDIAQVYIAIGPGSFTGLRIAVTLAKAMHLANAVEIVTVDSLDVIVANTKDESTSGLIQNGPASPRCARLAAILDAKRGQFFTAVYERTPGGLAKTASGDSGNPGYEIPGSNNSTWRRTVPDCLMTTDELLREAAAGQTPLGLLGDGLLYHQEALRAAETAILDAQYWSPRAANVHALGYQKASAGQFADPLSLVPFYLRGPQVTLKKKV
jgi:tRNA threonylcarbamoyladenosine biosynthesis protein TsaB